jgi:hypothetical protein
VQTAQDSSQYLYRPGSICVLGNYSPCFPSTFSVCQWSPPCMSNTSVSFVHLLGRMQVQRVLDSSQ